MPSIEEVDAEVAAKAFRECGADIQLLDDFIGLINNGAALVTGRPIQRDINLITLLLLTRSVNSLWRAREDAVHGYPVQSLTHVRASLENWGTISYCEAHPDRMETWLRGLDGVSDGKPWPPGFNDLWAALDAQLGDKAREAYGVLSLFAHPRDGALRWLFHAKSSKTMFKTGGFFDRDDLNFCLYFATTIAQLFLKNIGGLQARMLNAPNAAWAEEANAVTARGHEFLARMNEYVASSVASAGDSPSHAP